MHWDQVAAVAVTLFFVMDPLGNIPTFNAILAGSGTDGVDLEIQVIEFGISPEFGDGLDQKVDSLARQQPAHKQNDEVGVDGLEFRSVARSRREGMRIDAMRDDSDPSAIDSLHEQGAARSFGVHDEQIGFIDRGRLDQPGRVVIVVIE